MELQKIGREALHLPQTERVQLIQRSVLRLEVLSEEALRSEYNFSVPLQLVTEKKLTFLGFADA
jgi:hypothetical protein